jgi:glycosyltransferase involved in cell wall biosynthesis
MSIDAMCGVRDHAARLAEGLAAEDVACSLHWLTRRATALAPSRAEIDAWAKDLRQSLERERPDAVLLHYSVFSFSYRGLPVFVSPVLAAVRRARLPLVTVLHEYAYPWGREGLRGTAWALSQRAELIAVMRASSAVVATIALRARQLERARWLPRRPLAVAPVFSNLPPAAAAAASCAGAGGRDAASGASATDAASAASAGAATIGLFGYSYERVPSALVLGALALLARRGQPARLELLGAPGPDSQAGREWLSAARELGVEDVLSFSGTLMPQELADALAACELLLFVDPAGPTSRKTTLAASLVSGRPLVALDGPRSWPELLAAQAALIAQPSERALADALAGLLADAEQREALGARGREFADQMMSVKRSAAIIAGLLADVLG